MSSDKKRLPALGKIEILQLFKQNMLKFLDALIELFPEESDLIVARILFEGNIENFFSHFYIKIISAKDMIKARDENFFLTDENIFTGINNNLVEKWKQIWQSNKLNAENKQVMWKWFEVFLTLCEMYNN